MAAAARMAEASAKHLEARQTAASNGWSDAMINGAKAQADAHSALQTFEQGEINERWIVSVRIQPRRTVR